MYCNRVKTEQLIVNSKLINSIWQVPHAFICATAHPFAIYKLDTLLHLVDEANYTSNFLNSLDFGEWCAE